MNTQEPLNTLFQNLETEPHSLQPLVQTLVEKSLEGIVIFNRNLSLSIHQAIQQIDDLLSAQLSEIMHHSNFTQLEGRWRGLHHLSKEAETGVNLKIKMLSLTKQELHHNLEHSHEFDQSALYKKIYEEEFGSPGGQPYAALVGDYEFSHEEKDLRLLDYFAKVASASFCSFISAASPKLLGLERWSQLNNSRNLSQLTHSIEHIAWRKFRERDDARFIYLCLPRALARLPYTEASPSIESFHLKEQNLEHNYCWMNAAYLLATQMCKAFSKQGWCISIRGTEGGGRVENLALHSFKDVSGKSHYQCPTEVAISDRSEAELSTLGLLPLCHYKNTDYAVFFGADSLQKPMQFDTASATENARISARLPYIMATSRFAHYLKIMARDKMGCFLNAQDAQDWLNNWILNYVNGNEQSKHELKAKYPLAEARIQVNELPGKAGCYQATAWLRPWLQMEELSMSMRLVARIPKLN